MCFMGYKKIGCFLGDIVISFLFTYYKGWFMGVFNYHDCEST